jgi:hypothetical protein
MPAALLATRAAPAAGAERLLVRQFVMPPW